MPTPAHLPAGYVRTQLQGIDLLRVLDDDVLELRDRSCPQASPRWTAASGAAIRWRMGGASRRWAVCPYR